MNRTNLFLICLMASIPAFSQVDTIADNIYEYNGNLGIGLTNPETLLHLKGDVATGNWRNLVKIHNIADGGLAFTGIMLETGFSGIPSVITDYGMNYTGSEPYYDLKGHLNIANNNRGLMLSVNSAAGNIKFLTGLDPVAGAAIERLRIDGDGNVGIGTKNPLSKLEVNGMVHSTAQGFKFPDGTVQTTAANGSETSCWNSDSNHIYYDQGNVGIGIQQPQNLLHLSGNYSTGSGRNLVKLHNTADGGLAFTGIMLETGYSGIPSVITDYGMNYTGSEPLYDLKGHLNIANNNRGLMLCVNSAIGNIKFLTGLDPVGGAAIERVRIDKDGNVGIGTKSPLSKLEVNGMIHSTSDGIKFPDGTIQTTAANDSGTGLWNSSDSNIYFNNGNVGIGTSAPDVRLRIEDSVDDGPDRALIRLKNLSTSYTSSVSLGLESNDSEHGMTMTMTSKQYTAIRDFDRMGVISVNGKGFSVYSTSDYGSIRFYTNMDQDGIIERMRIDSKGNVGIGTDEPAAKVEIADGDIYISDINSGIIMKSPDGKCWRGTLDNYGNLSFTNIDCPGEIQDFIASKSVNKSISIFPNPADNTITIASLNRNLKNISSVIYTIDGKVVRRNELNSDCAIVSLDNIPSGPYIIRVLDKRGRELGSETLIKE